MSQRWHRRAWAPWTWKQADTTVKEVASNNVNTGWAITTKGGILIPGDHLLCLEDKEFNRLTRSEEGRVEQEKLGEMCPKLQVPSSPTGQHSLASTMGITVGEQLQVVAVTGDGTKDGPDLEKAGTADTDVERRYQTSAKQTTASPAS